MTQISLNDEELAFLAYITRVEGLEEKLISNFEIAVKRFNLAIELISSKNVASADDKNFIRHLGLQIKQCEQGLAKKAERSKQT